MSQSSVGASTMEPGAVRASSAQDEDWSEIEALLEGTVPPSPAPGRVARPRRVALGAAAALTLAGGGFVALSSAATSGCRGDGCRASAARLEMLSDRPATIGGAPVRVVSIDAGTDRRDEPPGQTGRSVAVPAPRLVETVRRREARVPVTTRPVTTRPVTTQPRARRLPKAQPPLVAARSLPRPWPALAVAPNERRAPRRITPPVADSVRSIARRQAAPHAVVRLQRVWVSPSEWILVRAD